MFYFDLFQLISGYSAMFLQIGFFMLFVSICYCVFKPNVKWNYLILSIPIVLIGIGFSFLDPYLNSWDEQYHALVAKNLAEDPSIPVLIKNGTSQLEYRNWTNNHVWLHKQPLFLYQIALSIKLFGANVFAVRLPSILLHTLTTLLCFSIAQRFLSRNFALLTAVLFGVSDYYNEYVSGAIGMDHNDVSFMLLIVFAHFSPKSILDRHKFNDLEIRNHKIAFINNTLKEIENVSPNVGVYYLKTNKELLPNIIFFNKTKTKVALN
jgi:hypothetical protein